MGEREYQFLTEKLRQCVCLSLLYQFIRQLSVVNIKYQEVSPTIGHMKQLLNKTDISGKSIRNITIFGSSLFDINDCILVLMLSMSNPYTHYQFAFIVLANAILVT